MRVAASWKHVTLLSVEALASREREDVLEEQVDALQEEVGMKRELLFNEMRQMQQDADMIRELKSELKNVSRSLGNEIELRMRWQSKAAFLFTKMGMSNYTRTCMERKNANMRLQMQSTELTTAEKAMVMRKKASRYLRWKANMCRRQ